MVLNRKTLWLFAIFSICLLLGVYGTPFISAQTENASSLAATTSTPQAIRWGHNTFYANGRFWIFYIDGSKAYYTTSTNGEEWESPIWIYYDQMSYDYGERLVVDYDGTYVHVSFKEPSKGNVKYRRGTPNIDGSITWSTDYWQDGFSISNFGKLNDHYLAVDSAGYPYLTWSYSLYDLGEGLMDIARVTKSTANDGTWVTAEGYPLRLSDNQHTMTYLVSLNDREMYVFHFNVGMATVIEGKLWSGSTWGPEEIVVAKSVQIQASGFTWESWSFSAVSDSNGNIHLVFLEYETHNVIYVCRYPDYGWDEPVVIESSVPIYASPVISVDRSNDNLYVFWASDGVYYQKNVDGAWDVEPTKWIVESAFAYGPTSDVGKDGVLTVSKQVEDGYISLAYMAQSTTPDRYNIKFASLNLTPVTEPTEPTTPTLEPTDPEIPETPSWISDNWMLVTVSVIGGFIVVVFLATRKKKRGSH